MEVFPVGVVAWPIHPHLLFESLAYAVGFTLYRLLRRRRGDFLVDDTRWSLIVAVVLGAAVGAKLLHHLGAPTELAARWREPAFLLGGKTIVGALLGGWVAVELTKKALGIVRSTGDLYALPLTLGIAVGRIGCFLSGPADGTVGSATTLPTGVDFGDGVLRHPTQLYEIGFLFVVAAVLVARPRFLRDEGREFRLFLGSYLAFRVLIDFLKPAERFGGLGAIQWAAAIGLAWIVVAAVRASAVTSVESPGASVGVRP